MFGHKDNWDQIHLLPQLPSFQSQILYKRIILRPRWVNATSKGAKYNLKRIRSTLGINDKSNYFKGKARFSKKIQCPIDHFKEFK